MTAINRLALFNQNRVGTLKSKALTSYVKLLNDDGSQEEKLAAVERIWHLSLPVGDDPLSSTGVEDIKRERGCLEGMSLKLTFNITDYWCNICIISHRRWSIRPGLALSQSSAIELVSMKWIWRVRFDVQDWKNWRRRRKMPMSRGGLKAFWKHSASSAAESVQTLNDGAMKTIRQQVDYCNWTIIISYHHNDTRHSWVDSVNCENAMKIIIWPHLCVTIFYSLFLVLSTRCTINTIISDHESMFMSAVK